MVVQNDQGIAVAGDLSGSNPNASITGASTIHSRTASGYVGGIKHIVSGSETTVDPFVYLDAPNYDEATAIETDASDLHPGAYGSIDVRGRLLSLACGEFVITKALNMRHGGLRGDDVTIYFAPSATLAVGNNCEIKLRARRESPFRGVGIFVDRKNTNPIRAGNHVSLDIDAALYAPGADVMLQNAVDFRFAQCVVGSLKVRNDYPLVRSVRHL